jgi:Mn2+/Fe2+ NRAMP family transporter
MPSPKKTFFQILFWSVISAAFIGPGTISTASKAGSSFGYELLWALLLSTIGCIILQEAAARLPLISGHNLGEAISKRYGKRSFAAILALSAIIVGGIAYEAGNILGAVSGAGLVLGIDSRWLVLGIGVIAGTLLWRGSYRLLAQLLGIVVAMMGTAFLAVVVQLGIDWGAFFEGLLIPTLTENSGWLVIGLIGTTIVPYNLFLGSGIQQEGDIKSMRVGLVVAIALGGLISMIVLMAATGLEEPFSFGVLADYMEAKIGVTGSWLLGFGLFAAGFSSAITAPLAAAITVESILGKKEKALPATQSKRGRWVWIAVLAVGMLFGLLTDGKNATPEAVIIAAQVLNGLLLPAISILLFLLVNDRQLIPEDKLNPLPSNILLLLMVGTTSFLGLVQLLKAGAKIAGTTLPEGALPWFGGLALLLIIGLYMKTARLLK